jgi:adenylate cyclase class IV
MHEVELKSVVADLGEARRLVEAAGATLVFAGRLEDRRYDTRDRRLFGSDHVLRVRVYRPHGGDASGGIVGAAPADGNGVYAGAPRAYLDWKGPTRNAGGYKVREELSTPAADPDALAAILGRLGYVVTREVDRDIAHYEVGGTSVRFECYPRMDVLVEVEGTPEGIERTIAALALPRRGFTADRLAAFVARYEARTGQRAALSQRELRGDFLAEREDA